MRRDFDPLYNIFEQHLFNALVEDETTDEFLGRVVADYVAAVTVKGTVIPHEYRRTVETDIRDEVLEMLRKKTYGHYSLKEFREAKTVEVTPMPPQKTKTRRSRRAC